MDYQKHYDLLCERAKSRLIEEYTECHHIVPRCMGGDDSPENIVALTPEEHYVAHQLLVKMYPENKGLIWATLMMCGKLNHRSNKAYGWLRRKFSNASIGEKNHNYDGSASRKQWKNASKERREKQSSVMKMLNENKWANPEEKKKLADRNKKRAPRYDFRNVKTGEVIEKQTLTQFSSDKNINRNGLSGAIHFGRLYKNEWEISPTH